MPASAAPPGRRFRRPAALIGLVAGGLLVLAGGCRHATRADDLPLHWPTRPPAPLGGQSPTVLVSLADRLPALKEEATSLVLDAASGGTLRLVDGAGHRQQAPQLRIRWERRPLAQPLNLERLVLGPFPSYESAQAQADRWRQQGVTPVLARPGDWEVWAPATAPAAGLPARLERQSHRDGWQPVLETSAGPIDLAAPVRIEATAGLRWKGGRHPGRLLLLPDAYGTWTLIEQLPFETYLAGVVPHEIGAGSPPAALRAQAVLARTWALANQRRFAVDGYHLCSDTQCQVYSEPGLADGPLRQALKASAGQVLIWNGRPVQGVYSASNGGVIAGFDEAWAGSAPPYLRPALDSDATRSRLTRLPLKDDAAVARLLADPRGLWGQDHPRFRWQRRLTAEQLQGVAGAEAFGRPQKLMVAERGPSGRVRTLRIEGSSGALSLRLDQIRRRLPMLPSTLFTIQNDGPEAWLITGGGFGHGAGLSQAGAIDLARRGWSTERILNHYFPGTRLQALKSLPPEGSL